MSQILKKGFAALAKKVAAIVGGSVAAMSATESHAAVAPAALSTDASHQLMVAAKSTFKRKPMTLLKLNPANPSASILVARHGSHSSHSSHSSHRSRL